MSKFERYTVLSLQRHLKARGVQTSGKHKKELIAICEACDSTSLPLNPDLEETPEQSLSSYKNKLAQLGVQDPFSIVEKFKEINNLNDLPSVGLYTIFNYLLNSRSDYDDKKLNAYKSADDYRLYDDGHVEKVLYFDNGDNEIVSYMAHVKPTQRSVTYLKRKFYKLWILINKENGSIILAHCECKGG